MFKILNTIFCILTTSFLAASHPAPGQWNLIGQYLYLQPSVDDTYFIIESRQNNDRGNVSNILIGKERSNQFHFASAFRVGLEYGLCDCDRGFGVYYTNLDTSHRKTITGEFLTPTIGIEDFTYSMYEYEGRASSKISLDYKSLDLLFSQKIYECCDFDFRVLLGLEFARLHFHQHVNYVPRFIEEDYSSRVNQRAKTWGVGPKVGVEFDYGLCQFCNCFPGELNLNFFSTGSLLVGRPDAKTHISYTSDSTFYPYDIDLRKSTRVIPAFHMGLGLDYNICGSCYSLDVGVGYEFSTYIKSLMTMKNIAYYGRGLTDVEYSDFNFHGLYVSLSLQF